MNEYTVSRFDPRQPRNMSAGARRWIGTRSPEAHARAIRAAIRNTGWLGLSKRPSLTAALRGDTYSRPSERYEGTRALFQIATNEFLGWINADGTFCPAGE